MQEDKKSRVLSLSGRPAISTVAVERSVAGCKIISSVYNKLIGSIAVLGRLLW